MAVYSRLSVPCCAGIRPALRTQARLACCSAGSRRRSARTSDPPSREGSPRRRSAGSGGRGRCGGRGSSVAPGACPADGAKGRPSACLVAGDRKLRAPERAWQAASRCRTPRSSARLAMVGERPASAAALVERDAAKLALRQGRAREAHGPAEGRQRRQAGRFRLALLTQALACWSSYPVSALAEWQALQISAGDGLQVPHRGIPPPPRSGSALRRSCRRASGSDDQREPI